LNTRTKRGQELKGSVLLHSSRAFTDEACVAVFLGAVGDHGGKLAGLHVEHVREVRVAVAVYPHESVRVLGVLRRSETKEVTKEVSGEAKAHR